MPEVLLFNLLTTMVSAIKLAVMAVELMAPRVAAMASPTPSLSMFRTNAQLLDNRALLDWQTDAEQDALMRTSRHRAHVIRYIARKDPG